MELKHRIEAAFEAKKQIEQEIAAYAATLIERVNDSKVSFTIKNKNFQIRHEDGNAAISVFTGGGKILFDGGKFRNCDLYEDEFVLIQLLRIDDIISPILSM